MIERYTRIIAAVDGSESAAHAAAHAAALARALSVPLTLLHVFAVDPDQLMGVAGIPGIDPARLSQAEVDAAAKRAQERVFAAARQAIGEAGVTVEEHVAQGKPAPEILRYAEEQGPAMVVMGRRGYGRIGEFLLGSVSDRVIRQARFPVLVVH